MVESQLLRVCGGGRFHPRVSAEAGHGEPQVRRAYLVTETSLQREIAGEAHVKVITDLLDHSLTPPEGPAPNYLAWVTQDEFNNTYQGCGYDAACNYVP